MTLCINFSPIWLATITIYQHDDDVGTRKSIKERSVSQVKSMYSVDTRRARAPCGLGTCKNVPFRFLAGGHKRCNIPGLVFVLSSAFFVYSCQYQCNQLHGKSLRNELLKS